MRKKMDLIWAISLIVIGIATLILAGSNIVGIELPYAIARLIGVIDLIALPFLVYSSVKKRKRSSQR